MKNKTLNKAIMDTAFRSRSKHTPKPEDTRFGRARHAIDEVAFNQAEKRLEKEFDEIWVSL